MKKLISLTLFAALSSQVFAAEDIHLKTLERSQELLEPRTDAISLEQAKEMAAGESVDARLAYENLYQAHQRIHQARAEYFPYGAGDLTVLYLTNFWNPLILAELVTSIPSKWHNVAKHKHLRNAEVHRLESLRENLKNQIAKLYYGTLKGETVLALTGYEIRLLEEMIRILNVQIQTGLATEEELAEIEYSTLKIRDHYLKLQAFLAEEKSALKMLLNISYDSKDMVFQPVRDVLNQEDLVIDLDNLALTSLNRSHEVKAAEQMVYAASRARSSEKWSILSFTGLGLDYMERVRYAGSKLQQAILEKEALERNIEREVYSRESVLRNSIDLTHSEISIMENSKKHMLAELARYKTGAADALDLIDADLYFLRDFRKVVVAHYNSLSRLDDLERIALGNVAPQYEEDRFEVAFEPVENGISLTLSSDLPAGEILSVTYTFAQEGLMDVKTFDAENGHRAFVPMEAGLSALSGSAIVILKNGEAVKKEFKVSKQHLVQEIVQELVQQ